jgi:hypothetical protein
VGDPENRARPLQLGPSGRHGVSIVTGFAGQHPARPEALRAVGAGDHHGVDPSSGYWARIPPVEMTSSSGWAWTAISVRAAMGGRLDRGCENLALGYLVEPRRDP